MAMVKAKYVKRGAKTRSKAKANIRYIQNRPDKNHKQEARELFGSDGPLTLDEVYRMIDEAGEGTLFYKIIISPDPSSEDLPRDIDLRELTIQTINRLEERLKTTILFAAAEHTDHSPHRHVHVLALLNKKLSKADLLFLRQSAAQAVLLQRQIRDLKLEIHLNLDRLHARAGESVPSRSRNSQPGKVPASARAAQETQNQTQSTPDSSGSGTPPRQAQFCPNCYESGTPMQKISALLYRCPQCHIIMRHTGMGLNTERLPSGPDLSL